MKSGKLLLAGYISFIIILIVLSSLSFLTPGNSLLLSNSHVNELNYDWTILSDSIKISSENLPFARAISPGESITIKKILPEDFHSKRFLLIRSSLQEVSVTLDGVIIYEVDFEGNSFFKIPVASLWNIVEIPDNSDGKAIAITFYSDYSRFRGVVNPIVYGSVGDLNLYIIKKYALPFSIAVIIFLLGCALCIIPIFIKSQQKSKLLFLGLFTVVISLWFFAESRMLQFFTGNRIVLGSLAYLMLALLPVPLSIYICEVISDRFKKIYTVFISICCLNFLLIILFQITGVLAFYNSLFITHIVMVSFLILTVFIIAYEIVKNDNHLAKNIFYSSVFLMAFGIAELMNFYMTRNTIVGKYLLIGVIFFISIQAFTYLHQIQKQNLKSIEADMLRELAYKDYMTKGGNRLAFELEMERVFSDREKLERFGLIFFDVDGLKKINDELGHMAGDEAIVFSCELINEVFGAFGKCYRIGGDEFAALIHFSNEHNADQKIKDLIDLFNLKIKEGEDRFEYPLAVSAGGILYEPKFDKDIKSMMSRADKTMYENKNMNKNKNRNRNK